MILRRLLISSAISTFYLTISQTISCQNCTTSSTCSNTDTCSSQNCFLVSQDVGTWMTNGCVTLNGTSPPNYTVNNASVNGICFWRDNSTRICACRSPLCNNLFDSDKFPNVTYNPLPSIDIDAMLSLAEQTPITMVTTVASTTLPVAVTTPKVSARFFSPIHLLRPYYPNHWYGANQGNIRSGVVPSREIWPKPVINEGTLRPHVCGFNPYTRQCMDPEGYCPGRCMNFHYTYNTIYECRCLVI
ncbi:unnamed protein product, partial [Mesorhabditis belari]|uniref:Uncharacterized protein n=1 Tax=Mesorhabditis belari TaxID=2138241 RepID=A0AAF3F779_9BILA